MLTSGHHLTGFMEHSPENCGPFMLTKKGVVTKYAYVTTQNLNHRPFWGNHVKNIQLCFGLLALTHKNVYFHYSNLAFKVFSLALQLIKDYHQSYKWTFKLLTQLTQRTVERTVQQGKRWDSKKGKQIMFTEGKLFIFLAFLWCHCHCTCRGGSLGMMMTEG